LLNEPLKKNHALILLCGSIYLVFSFDALFGLTWRMLTTCLALTSHHNFLVGYVVWRKVLGCVVCRFHVAAGEKLHADK
jgi:hypothetical protein